MATHSEPAKGVITVTRTDGDVVCSRCVDAHTPWKRTRGLLGKRALGPDEGILLRPGSSIHTLFMRFPIDAVFLDGDNRVLKIVSDLPPWRFASSRGSKAVVELAAGRAAQVRLRAGDQLAF